MPTETDIHSGTPTTGHEWDGIHELDTPLPKWWLYTWITCIIWAVVWCFLYPSIPLGVVYWHGVLGHTNRADVDREVRAVTTQRSATMDRVAALSFAEIRGQPGLMEAALINGRITFANNCQPCHGAGGTGAVGYPALTAGAWIWGGKLEDIQHTLTVGIRSGQPDARDSQMPPFGELLKPEEIAQVASFVMTLYQSPAPTARPEDVSAGAALFATNCAACHGEAGQGNRAVGAPRLASRVHLYGSSLAAVVGQITRPHMGVMPAWNARLDPATIKSLALYVHDLGGGE